MRLKWVLVTHRDEITPTTHLRATGYDDQELHTLTPERLDRLIALKAIRRRDTTASGS